MIGLVAALATVGGAYYLNAQDGCSATSQNAYGLSIAYRSPQQLYNDSDSVVAGTVVESSTLCIDKSGGSILQTTTKVKVDEYLKAPLGLDFVVIKDDFSLVRSQFELPPTRYEPGERVVLFLSADDDDVIEDGEFSFAAKRTLAANQTGISILQGIGSELEPRIVHLAPNYTATTVLHIESFFGFSGPVEVTKGRIEIHHPSSTGDLEELEARDDMATTMKLEQWIMPVFPERTLTIGANDTVSMPISIVVSEDAEPGLYMLFMSARTDQAPAEGHDNMLQFFVNITDAGVQSQENASAIRFPFGASGGSNLNVVITGVGDEPRGIAINPATNIIYVANRGSDSLSVVDGSDNRVVGNITVGDRPVAVAVNPDTNVVYVANSGSSTVSVIDGASGALVADVPVPGSPVSIAVNTVKNIVYVANAYSGNITIINGSSLEVERIIDADRYITDIEVDPGTDMIFYTTPMGGLVQMPDCPEWCGIGLFGTGPDPRSIVLDSKTAYVASYEDGSLSVIDISVFPSYPPPYSDGISAVDGLELAFDDKRNLLYATNPNYGTVTVVDVITKEVVDRVKVMGSGSSGIAIHPENGTVYVANYLSGSVSVLNPHAEYAGNNNNSTTTLTGQVACLPLKDPRDAECALGFQDSDGRHYSLRVEDEHYWIMSTQWSEGLFNVTGVLIHGSEGSIYDIAGTIDVSSVGTADGSISIYEVFARHHWELQAIVEEVQAETGSGYVVEVGECDGEQCIKVTLEFDVPEITEKIPRQLEGYRVDVEISNP